MGLSSAREGMWMSRLGSDRLAKSPTRCFREESRAQGCSRWHHGQSVLADVQRPVESGHVWVPGIDSLDKMHFAWMVSLLEPKSVVQTRDGEFFLVLGSLPGGFLALVWNLEGERRGKFEHVFVLGGEQDRALNKSVTWLAVLDWEQVKVVPSDVLSPMGAYAALGGKGAQYSGVVIRQTGVAVSILEHAAVHCFWRLDAKLLSRVASSRGIHDAPTQLFPLISVLIKTILKKSLICVVWSSLTP